MKSQAIQYFPFNVDFYEDDKLALIEGEFGIKGSYVATRLLCKVFSTNGYYYQWGGDECLLFCKKLGAEFVPNLVEEIVRGLVRRSFFDKGVFDSFSVLTSRGIQNRYFEAIKRRKTVTVRREFLLVDPSKFGIACIFEENVNISSENVNIFSQSRVKESKEKNYSSSLSSSLPSEAAEEAEEQQEEFFLSEMFFRNWAAPSEELRKFKAFNNTGGRHWAKMDASERQSAFDLWRQKPEKPARFPAAALSAWRRLYTSLKENNAPKSARIAALDDGVAFRANLGKLMVLLPASLREYLSGHPDKETLFHPALRELAGAYGVEHLDLIGYGTK